jgi:hypothetical protein
MRSSTGLRRFRSVRSGSRRGRGRGHQGGGDGLGEDGRAAHDNLRPDVRGERVPLQQSGVDPSRLRSKTPGPTAPKPPDAVPHESALLTERDAPVSPRTRPGLLNTELRTPSQCPAGLWGSRMSRMRVTSGGRRALMLGHDHCRVAAAVLSDPPAGARADGLLFGVRTTPCQLPYKAGTGTNDVRRRRSGSRVTGPTPGAAVIGTTAGR